MRAHQSKPSYVLTQREHLGCRLHVGLLLLEAPHLDVGLVAERHEGIEAARQAGLPLG